MKKYLFILFSCRLFAASPLVVGTTSGYAPFVSLNEKGEYEGFDIDVGKELARKLGRDFVLKDCGSMPSLMLALKQEKIDVIIWAVSITDERLKNIEMVYYQGEKVDEIPVIFWKELPKDVKSLSDLGKNSKRIVSIEAGSYQEDILKRYPGVSLKYLDKVSDVILDLKYGKAFASAIDPSLVAGFKKKFPELQVMNLPLPPESQSLGNGICINKSNQELANKVRKAIAELIKEGKIAGLEKKWGLK